MAFSLLSWKLFELFEHISNPAAKFLCLFTAWEIWSIEVIKILRESNTRTQFWQVITAQYFVWFFCILPLILPWSYMKLKWKGLSCIFLWMGAQLHWLMWGYMLEFKGKNVFLQLWMASIFFLAANTYVLTAVIHHHRFSSVFTELENTSEAARKLQWWNK